MKTVSGELVSSTPITVSKAASILSRFVSAETGASQAVSAYLRRATFAFDELVRLHSKIDRKKYKKPKSDASTAAVAAEEKPSGSSEASQGPKKIEFGNVVKDENKMVKIEIKEEKSKGDSNVGEDTGTRKKKKKEKGGDFGNSQDDVGTVGTKVKEEKSHGEDNFGEEIERSKHKKKKRDRENVGNFEDSGVEIGKTEAEIKRELKEEEERRVDTIGKLEESGVKMEIKENRKKRKNREVEEESRDEAEEQQSKKKKKRRRKVGAEDN